MVEVLPDEVAHAERGGVGGEDHVGVGEEEDFAGGRSRAAPGRMRLPEPARREFFDVQDVEASVAGGQTLGYLSRAVGGAVVDQDDFVVMVVEGEERPQGGFHGALLVVCGDDDREAGERRLAGVWWGHVFQPGDPVAIDQGADGEGHPCGKGEGRQGEREGQGRSRSGCLGCPSTR